MQLLRYLKESSCKKKKEKKKCAFSVQKYLPTVKKIILHGKQRLEQTFSQTFANGRDEESFSRRSGTASGSKYGVEQKAL